ncbi:hypothetical protein PG997_005012 [Apiospora hydei]|uniref:Uncharacterized protein n=1 Tax=Apiospora hydei TaxID=1337664 RepID=A0ABR1X3Q9_9PEZI
MQFELLSPPQQHAVPYLEAEAPPHIPEGETIEWLLGEVDNSSKSAAKTKTYQELTDEERERTGLVRLSKRTDVIQGDPYGVLSSWTGNVSHQLDSDMTEVLKPIFEDLVSAARLRSAEISRLAAFLSQVPNTDPVTLAEKVADDGDYEVIEDTAESLELCFSLDSKRTRILWAKDLDVDNEKSYDDARRAKSSASRTKQVLTEPVMSITEQQILMARLYLEKRREFPGLVPDRGQKDSEQSDSTSSFEGFSGRGILATLRSVSQEHFWLRLNVEQRQYIRDLAELRQDHPELESVLSVIRANWKPTWNNGRYDTDYFRSYLVDSSASESVWKLVEDDLFIVLDQNRRPVFVNREGLVQSLYGNDVFDKLIRAIDLMTFYRPIPRPETKRHALDRHLLTHRHPELDPGRATIHTLPNAKMGVAHYGCWALKGDWHGRDIYQTKDTRAGRCFDNERCAQLIPRFMRAIFGTASDLVRFLLQPLDPVHYQECRDLFAALPDSAKTATNEQDFCSLFVLGVNAHTQRHRDTGDVKGGLAGLVTLGNYTGGNLCLPQLGLKVPYRPGACALLRGSGLEHLVTDFRGPRFFVVATNHETSKKYAWRAMGRLPPLPKRRRRIRAVIDDDDDEDKEAHGPWMP